MLRSFIEKQQATYDFAFERPVPDRRELSAATLRRWVLASLLGMLAIECNEILGNTPHGIDADASLEGGSVPRASINGRRLVRGRRVLPGRAHFVRQCEQWGGPNDATTNDAPVGSPLDAGGDAPTVLTGTNSTGGAEPGNVTSDAATVPDVMQSISPPSCIGGAACAPNDCQNGTWTCTDAGRVCQEMTAVRNGMPCGANSGDAGARVCSAGQCVACNAGFVQVGDFVGVAVRHAARRQATRAVVVGMMGKLSKMADGRMRDARRRLGSENGSPRDARGWARRKPRSRRADPHREHGTTRPRASNGERRHRAPRGRV